MAEKASWQSQNFKKNAPAAPSGMNSKIAGNSIGSMHSKIARPSVKNYADGGEVTSDTPKYDMGEFAGVDEAVARNSAMATDSGVEVSAVREPEVETKEIKQQSFKEAFAENRKAGNSTFEWNGKTYTTELAKPKAAPTPGGGGKSIMLQDKPKAAPTRGADFDPDRIDNFTASKPATKAPVEQAKTNTVQAVKPRGKGIIDTSNIDSKTLLPKR